MSTASVLNGKPQRKQLSEQLDRFDALLDGLSEGLSEAVADAARAGTRLAVKDAIVEILTDPTLRTQLHQATAPNPLPTASKPGFWAKLKSGASRLGGAIRRSVTTVSETVRGGLRRAGELLRDPLQFVRMLGSVKRLLMLGVGVGTVVACLSYLAPHLLSAFASGVGAGATAMAVQIGIWSRRTFRLFSAT
jgi:hypothetical protein